MALYQQYTVYNVHSSFETYLNKFDTPIWFGSKKSIKEEQKKRHTIRS